MTAGGGKVMVCVGRCNVQPLNTASGPSYGDLVENCTVDRISTTEMTHLLNSKVDREQVVIST